MDQEKSKTSNATTNSIKNQVKSLQRHQEHNYTNPSINEMSTSKSESTGDLSDVSDNHRLRNPGIRLSNTSQHKGDSNQRQGAQSSSTTPSDRHHLEVKSKTIKKDVFNRIRRSEEELQKAAEMVRGGMTFQTASDTFNIPISTIRFFMARRGILPQRRRGRGSSGVRDDDLIHPPFEIIHYRLPDIDKPF